MKGPIYQHGEATNFWCRNWNYPIILIILDIHEGHVFLGRCSTIPFASANLISDTQPLMMLVWFGGFLQTAVGVYIGQGFATKPEQLASLFSDDFGF